MSLLYSSYMCSLNKINRCGVQFTSAILPFDCVALFQDVGELLSFDYLDDDIASLRVQMKLPVALVSPSIIPQLSPGESSILGLHATITNYWIDRSSSIQMPLSPASSELSELEPPLKKRRVSTSSLSEEDDDEDEEEDKPLAARMRPVAIEHGARTVASGKRSGKKVSSMKSKAQTAATPVAPLAWQEAEMNGKLNGINGHDAKVKLEDKMDEGQLTRLATGVTIDASGTTSTAVR